jgi:HNH endonuclease
MAKNSGCFRSVDPIVAFWSHIDTSDNDGCWLWTAHRSPDGYGQAHIKRHPLRAHRLMWYLVHGDPGDLKVLHACDNPPCVNPNHLFIGTNSDNMFDAVDKGRHSQSRKTHCPHGHPYSGKNLMWVKTKKGITRRCKVCVYASNKAVRQRNYALRRRQSGK